LKTVFVLFDSLNRRVLGCYGGKRVPTPNFDRLAARTMVYDRHYVGSLPCMPARRDLETAILDLYGATNCLMLFAEVTLPNNDKREGPLNSFRTFHLNDQQYNALFYLLYAVNGHVRDLRNGAGFGDDPKVQP
jgi:hypothetical protein